MDFKNYFLVGGAGFIGSHFTDTLLALPNTNKVTIYDNLSSGKEWHYAHHLSNPKFNIIKADVKDTAQLQQAMTNHDVVMHFASNPDIAKAAIEPGIDFTEGMLLTFNVLEAARLNKVKRIIYTSGSGVYGDIGLKEAREDQGSLLPISTYGASKLAGEAFISSYCYMFDISACVFRFGNVVGPRQTHGVGYDFIRKLIKNASSLTILGDGNQSKSYIYIQDVITAVFLAHLKQTTRFEVYNVATGDYITVREIAEMVLQEMKLNDVNIKFSGGDRGWKGDIPIVRLNTDKIQSLGWKCELNATEAMRNAVRAMLLQLNEEVAI